VFVEPPPNAEWTAATGTFKAIFLKSEEAAQGTSQSKGIGAEPNTGPDASPPWTSSASADPSAASEPRSYEDEIELDADYLSDSAEMRRLRMDITGTRAGIDADSGDTNATHSGPSTPPATNAADTQTRQKIPSPGRPMVYGPQSASDAAASTGTSRSPFAPPPRAGSRSSAETQSQPQLRSPAAETPSQPQLRSPTGDTESSPEELGAESTAARTKNPKVVRAFGLDSEPLPERLASVARARVAPAPPELELEPRTRDWMSSITLWSSGVAVLVLVLVAQIVNHYRNDLAASARFNKPITALYNALGVKLTPHWDLHAYDVRQLGASADSASAGQIMVRASVKNSAQQALPMPLLRVTLQDRFGNRIAARDVPPGNYLPHATAATSFLPPGQRIDAEMAFVDPGSNAVGFEIDACLPAPAGGIACANDPVSR